jgi:preprotein translocase subunit SecF
MKAEDSNKRKPPAQKRDDKKEASKAVVKDNAVPAQAPVPESKGLLSMLKFPELPLKQAIGIPLVVLVIALLITGYTFFTTGSPLHLGVDFKGGTMVTLKTTGSDAQLQSEFGSYPINLISDAGNGQKTIRFDQMSSDQQDSLANYVNEHYPGSSIEHTGSTWSAANQTQAVWAIVIAFIGMAITIFIIFRSFVPCVAVIMSAFSDIMIAVALMNLFNIDLTFGTFAALLMLIGYSVDTDILLTTKVLGERKYIDKKITSVRATGLTMTGAAIAAFLVLHIVSSYDFLLGFSPIPVLAAISTVMIFGLVADLMNTWFFNAGLLKWYMESPEAKVKYG